MRYQRYRYRFAVAMMGAQPRPFAELTRALRLGVQLAQPCWQPPADVYETSDAFVAMVELAGIDEEDVTVLLFEDALIVEGQRRIVPAETPGFYHAAEIRQGPFRVELALPAPVDADRAEAWFDRGLLRVVLPKLERG